MKKINKQFAIMLSGLLLIFMLIYGKSVFTNTQTIYEIRDFTRCSIDSSKFFNPIPTRIMLELPDWDQTLKDNEYIASTLDNKVFTASSLRAALVYYQVQFCSPSTSDFCVDQKVRSERLTADTPITVSSSLISLDDGVYWNNVKVIKGDQQFIVVYPSLHPEIIKGEDSYAIYPYNRKYIGNLYGIDDAEQLKCATDYNIDMSLPRKDIVSTTTTSTTTTTTSIYQTVTTTLLTSPIFADSGLIIVIGGLIFIIVMIIFYIARR